MKITLFLLISMFLVGSFTVEVKPVKPRESICIMSNSSAKETVVFNAVIHDGKIFPLVGDSRTGCLLLHDISTWDANGDGKLEPKLWGHYVPDAYNHCCTGGG